jgi:signal transduction histidine kinase
MRIARRLAWLFAGLSIAVTAVGMYFQYLDRHTFVPIDFGTRSALVTMGIVFLAMPLVGALIAARRPSSPLGWLFIAIGMTMSIYILADGYAVYAVRTAVPAPRGGHVSAWLANWVWVPGWGMTALVFLLFPTGKLPSPGWRPVAWAAGLVTALVWASLAFERGPLANYLFVFNPYGRFLIGEDSTWIKLRGMGLFSAIGVVVIASLFIRLRRATGDERQQLKWITYAGAVVVAVIAVWVVLVALRIRNTPAENASEFVAVLVPISAGVAVLKYRLYDIDVVINKTLVYGALAAFLTAVYVAIVVGIGATVGTGGEPNLGLSILATAVVAVAFQPVRERAQRLANRLVYGERATPYEVLADFSERVGTSASSEDVLPLIAQIFTEGTGVARAEVWLRVGRELRPGGVHPSWNGSRPEPMSIAGEDVPTLAGLDAVFPVRHQGELLGAIGVTVAVNQPLKPAQEKLMSDLSLQAGLVLRNVRLIAELRESRQRIVAAQDAERRRLERNIHDGAQQQLVALAVKLRLAETMAGRDPAKTRAILSQLQAETTDALENLRDLARGIYPPLLADQGLVAALDAQGRKARLPVSLRAAGVGRYSQEVEAAVYFCCLEALQNVAKYAQALHVAITLEASDSELRFTVRDDGRGFDPDRTPRGSGLTNMGDRLAALGGTLEIRSQPRAGTTVSGRLPVRPPQPAS